MKKNCAVYVGDKDNVAIRQLENELEELHLMIHFVYSICKLGKGSKKNPLWKIPYWGGVSEGHFQYPFFYFFCSKWSNNHF